ncbi:MFS transporter [Bauldia litoralis]|uniref:Predicted arabinose efflux permease, MFS family n=1 Tax=Bauldia litoralis TaxID=665467 RepID=A0A1G6C8N8_9HYPH|nr:MFS transporter [Bauldia litoralis]SDB29275.1 Predicted arabinose efflux permease, MFS family [Bauldia litoralis]
MSNPSVPSPSHSVARAIPVILVAGCIIAAINFGPRATMGFFLTPMTTEYGWSREAFALAIAIQNLVWGIGQPFVGMLADRFGTARVLSIGALFYALGLALMSQTSDAGTLQLTAGVLIGLGIAGSAFLLVLAAFARLLPEHLRSIGYGFGTAAGSVGQFVFAPLGQGFIQAYGWQTALLIMAAIVLAIPVLSFFIRGKPAAVPARIGEKDQSIPEALREAFRHPSYRLLVTGFFVCGFQIAFITVHLPPYLSDIGIPALYGGYAIALIGFFNIMGSISSGVLTGRMRKRILLAGIYLARSVVIVVFLLVPPSIPSVLIFSAAMGFLWLSTVPPTQQLVVVMFGTRYVATLFGFVFFSHQVGSFFGVWLGGVLYDATGSYDIVWWLSAGLGVLAALVHLPIVERHVERPLPA